jgi:hypothetical protein
MLPNQEVCTKRNWPDSSVILRSNTRLTMSIQEKEAQEDSRHQLRLKIYFRKGEKLEKLGTGENVTQRVLSVCVGVTGRENDT